MHCEVSGCGDLFAKSEQTVSVLPDDYLRYMPSHAGAPLPTPGAELPRTPGGRSQAHRRSDAQESQPGLRCPARDRGSVDEGSFFEVKRLFARELVTGFARIEGTRHRHRRFAA